MISSFDEFAKDAEAGVVYYHKSEDVYYWLSLKSIWGYIGYNFSNRTFYNNGKPYTIIPSVPDPESLTGPIIINSDSTTANSILLQYSAFNIVPVQMLYYFGGKLVIDCNNTYDFDTIKLYNPNAHRFDVEYLNFDLSKIKYITRQYNSTSAYLYLTINDTNNVLNLDELTISSHSSSTTKYTTWLKIVYDKNKGIMSEDLIFDGIETNLEKLNEWNVQVDCSNVDTLEMTLRENLPQPYKCINMQEGYLLILDAAKSNGVVPNNYYSYLSGSNYVRDIVYRNVTDYGTYYKRYLLSEDYVPLTQEVLDIMKGDYIEIYSDAKVIDGDWSKVSKSSLNLEGVKHFVYYAGALPTTPVRIQSINSYNDIVENGIVHPADASLAFNAVSTPMISNVNLESFGCGYNMYNYIYFNTVDSDIYIKNLIVPGSAFNLYPGLANIHISSVKTDYAHGHSLNSCTINIYSMDTLDKGGVYLENIGIGHGKTITLWCSSGSHNTEKIRTYVADCTGLENPTPDDYYSSGVTHSSLFYSTNWLSNSYDYAIMRSGYAANYIVPLSRIKCLYGGGSFSGKSLISSSEDMATLIGLVPNVSSTATFTFDETQASYLTQTQIDFLTSLGYTITIQH